MVNYQTEQPTEVDKTIDETRRTLASIRQSAVRKPFREMIGWNLAIVDVRLVLMADGTEAALIYGGAWHNDYPERVQAVRDVTDSPYVVAVVRDLLAHEVWPLQDNDQPVVCRIVSRGRSYTLE